MKNMSKCQFITPDKTQCEAKPLKGEEFCFWHSPNKEQERKKAVQDGGNSPKRNYGVDDEVKLGSSQDVRELMEKTIRNMNQNKISVNMANATGYLANIALKAIEQGDLEKRLEVLEYAFKIKK